MATRKRLFGRFILQLDGLRWKAQVRVSRLDARRPARVREGAGCRGCTQDASATFAWACAAVVRGGIKAEVLTVSCARVRSTHRPWACASDGLEAVVPQVVALVLRSCRVGVRGAHAISSSPARIGRRTAQTSARTSECARAGRRPKISGLSAVSAVPVLASSLNNSSSLALQASASSGGASMSSSRPSSSARSMSSSPTSAVCESGRHRGKDRTSSRQTSRRAGGRGTRRSSPVGRAGTVRCTPLLPPGLGAHGT